jgi:hypothetical protein
VPDRREAGTVVADGDSDGRGKGGRAVGLPSRCRPLDHGGDQLTRADGLIEVGVGVGEQAAEAIARLHEGREDDRGEVDGGGIAAEGADQLIAVHIWHAHLAMARAGRSSTQRISPSMPLQAEGISKSPKSWREAAITSFRCGSSSTTRPHSRGARAGAAVRESAPRAVGTTRARTG